MTSYKTGLLAERLAEIALTLKGYRILTRRYKTPMGEVDLVMKRGNVLAFVEVKHRKILRDGLEAVHPRNQQRVRDATMLYLQEHPEYTDMDIRFDAVVVTPKSWPCHIPRAWD